jgi:hypothetical protein
MSRRQGLLSGVLRGKVAQHIQNTRTAATSAAATAPGACLTVDRFLRTHARIQRSPKDTLTYPFADAHNFHTVHDGTGTRRFRGHPIAASLRRRLRRRVKARRFIQPRREIKSHFARIKSREPFGARRGRRRRSTGAAARWLIVSFRIHKANTM